MSSSSKPDSISVLSLYKNALENITQAGKYISSDDQAQEYLRKAALELNSLSKRIQALSLFSPNETLEDIATRELIYMFVPYAQAEVEGKLKTAGPEERIDRLRESERHLRSFIHQLDDYEIVPADEKALFLKIAGTVPDPSKRRETKIKQFQKEKEIKGKISAIRMRKRLPEVDMTDEIGMIHSLLPSGKAGKADVDSDDEDDDENDLRELILLVLRLTWTQATSQLETMNQELDILRSAPRMDEWGGDGSKNKEDERDLTWRLDNVTRGGPDGKGPLMDSKGKPLRPFTILPSSAASERMRLQGEVFRPDHRLPTMTIDEYLEEENRRGNIISGGGPASENVPTSSEKLTMESEEDGTFAGESKAEEKRRKDEEWAQYTDDNRKGSGNTMNRG